MSMMYFRLHMLAKMQAKMMGLIVFVGMGPKLTWKESHLSRFRLEIFKILGKNHHFYITLQMANNDRSEEDFKFFTEFQEQKLAIVTLINVQLIAQPGLIEKFWDTLLAKMEGQNVIASQQMIIIMI